MYPSSSIYELLQYETHRKTRGRWSFNSFRDVIVESDNKFLQDIFHNFSILPGAIDTELPWYEQQLLVDNHVIIRFEFDNATGQKLLIHNVDINTNNSSL